MLAEIAHEVHEEVVRQDPPLAIHPLERVVVASCDDGLEGEGIGKHLSHAVLTSEGTDMETRGADAIAQQYRATTRLYPDTGTPKTKHVITNLIIDVDEESGTGRCRSCYTVFQQTDALPLQPIIAGRYHHTFERADGEWRALTQHFFVDLVGDLSQHLLIDIDTARNDET